MIEKWNWNDIQIDIDNGFTYRSLIKKYKGLNNANISTANKSGLIKTKNKSEATSHSFKTYIRKHTQETKDKISKKRKEYLKNNPDKVPYKLNHSHKESYPEKYFTDVFDNNNIKYIKEFYTNGYFIDFVVGDKVGIEIDGEQHYLDTNIITHDLIRYEKLNSENWKIIRIRWSEYQKMNFDNKKRFISELINYINGCNILPHIYYIKKKKGFNKCECGGDKYHTSKNCAKCSFKLRGIKNKPTHETILEDLKTMSYVAVGKKYGVSDNAIRKWLKSYSKT